MTTALLENNNKFAYLGLKRRPTYDELIGLINENASLFGTMPDRRATAFKASPEGSFFDGLNYTDRLKEEQERILNKQMRDLLFRQNVGNQSIAIAQLQQNNQSSTAMQTQTLPTGNIAGAGIAAQLEQVRQQQETRRQQAGEAHRGMLPMIQGVMSNIMSLSPARTRTQTPMAQPIPQSFNISSEDEPELMTDTEMQTARGEPITSDGTILNSLKFRNSDASETQLTRALNVLSKFKNLQPEQIATSFNNFATLNNIYATLADNGFIDDDVWEEYQELTSRISNERGGRKRAKLLGDLANHDRNNIYDKFINEIANRPSGSRG